MVDSDYFKRYYREHKDEFLVRMRKFRVLNPDKKAVYDRKFNLLQPEVKKARNLAYRYVKLGDCCEFCGSKDRLTRHHPDYDFPLLVVTACFDCNIWADKPV